MSWPTPGIVISRRHAPESLAIFFMSASIAVTADSTAVRADEAFHRCGQAGDPLADPQRLIGEGRTERARQADTEHHGETTDLVRQHDALTDQVLTRNDQRANGMRRERLHVHGLEESGAGKVRQTTGIVAIGLVGRKGLQRLVRLPASIQTTGRPKAASPW